MERVTGTVPLVVQAAPLQEQLGAIIQAMAKDAGFDVRVAPTEFTTALKLAQGGRFTMFQIGWSGRLDPDQNIYSFYAPHSGLNYTGSDDPTITNLLARAIADGRRVLFVAEKRAEWDGYTAHVSSWETDRYLRFW